MCNWKHHIREVNQTQKDRRCVLSLICGSYILIFMYYLIFMYGGWVEVMTLDRGPREEERENQMSKDW